MELLTNLNQVAPVIIVVYPKFEKVTGLLERAWMIRG